jgi:hypothetical protein
MPWIAPSHQAPVLPLKTWKPQTFSGLALCIGAAAPDLEFILRLDYDWIVSHRFAAQIYFTVPLVLLLHALMTRLVLPWLIPLLPSGAPFHLHDLALIRPASSSRDWIRVGVSGFLGGMSHLLLDGFTHGNQTGWGVALLPFLRTPVFFLGRTLPIHDLLHVAGTIVFGAFSLWALSDIAKKRMLVAWNGGIGLAATATPREATSVERRGAIQYLFFCASLGLVIAMTVRDDARGPWFEIAAHGVLAFLFYGVVIAAAADRWRSRSAAPAIIDASEG